MPRAGEADPLFGAYLLAVQKYGARDVDLHLRLVDCTQLVALVQLAARHPVVAQSDGPLADFARAFVSRMAQQLNQVDPVFAQVIKQGWNPEEDTPR